MRLSLRGLMSKLWTSSTGKQVVTINIFPNNARIKSNLALKFGKLIEYVMINIFLQKWIYIFKGIYFGCHCGIYIFLLSVTLTYNQNKLYKISYCWSRDLLNFDFLEKGLWLVSQPQFVHYFSRKMFLVLYILLTDQI